MFSSMTCYTLFSFFFEASPHISCDSYVEVMGSKEMTSLGIDLGAMPTLSLPPEVRTKAFDFPLSKALTTTFTVSMLER